MKQVDSAAMKRAALVWGVAFVMLLAPHRGIVADSDVFLHRPWVLVLGPLLLAALSLLVPQGALRNNTCAVPMNGNQSRRSAWGGIAACSFLLLVLAVVLMAVDGNPPTAGTSFAHRLTIVFGAWMALLMFGIGLFLRRLQRSKMDREL